MMFGKVRCARACARHSQYPESLGCESRNALRQRHNWTQLAKFCVVGVSGYAVNLAVYTALLNGVMSKS